MKLVVARRLLVLVAAMMVFQASPVAAQSVFAEGAEAEETADGLQRLAPGIIPVAWVKPDLDLSKYTKILFMPTVTAFRPVSGRYSPRGSTHVEAFPIDEDVQEHLRALFGETFHEYIEQVKLYGMSDEVGRDVLMVQGMLVDVISGVPPVIPGANVTLIRNPWEATVMLELRDSMSDEILARTSDRQAVDGVFDVTEVWGVTQWIVREWSELLRMRFGDILDVGGGRWTRCQLRENDCTL